MKPELGSLKKGDKVLVIEASHRRYGDEEAAVEAEVTKVGRAWVTIVQLGTPYPGQWRMRIATQRTDNGTNYNNRFVTPEQYAWEQRLGRADAYLLEQGLVPSRESPWYAPERHIELANVLRTHAGLPEI